MSSQDRYTKADLSISTDHGKIHDGDGYSVSAIYAAVANAGVVNLCFKTPAANTQKLIHLKYRDILAASKNIRIDLYEAPTDAPINGSALTPINRNRNSANTSLMTVKSAMDITTAGAININSETHAAGDSRPMDQEFFLKANTWYLYTFTNSTGGATDISAFIYWYEEDK